MDSIDVDNDAPLAALTAYYSQQQQSYHQNLTMSNTQVNHVLQEEALYIVFWEWLRFWKWWCATNFAS